MPIDRTYEISEGRKVQVDQLHGSDWASVQVFGEGEEPLAAAYISFIGGVEDEARFGEDAWQAVAFTNIHFLPQLVTLERDLARELILSLFEQGVLVRAAMGTETTKWELDLWNNLSQVSPDFEKVGTLWMLQQD